MFCSGLGRAMRTVWLHLGVKRKSFYRLYATAARIYYFLQAHHLLRYKRRKRAQTTNSQHPFYKYENLVKDFTATGSDQLWVSDITYIRTGNDFSYLSLITDAYSHQIMGWALEPTLHTKGLLSALQLTIKFKGKGKKS